MRAIVLALLLATLVACGDRTGPSPGPRAPAAAPADEVVKARLLALFAAVEGGGGAALAPFLAYTGPDESRQYKEPERYTDPEDARAVDQIFRRTRNLLAHGAPTFVKFETRVQSTGLWHAWSLVFGSGAKEKKALFAFVETPFGLLLGDID